MENSESSETACIHRVFERKALFRPNAIAVSFRSERVTYEQLNQRANFLAAYLREAPST
jgi:non-ribosomal peptide synthetase component F